MRDLETRIYHDAERTAAEVTPADVRPLDLQNRPGSHSTRWSGGSHSGGSRPGGSWSGGSWSGGSWSGGSRPGTRARRILAPVAAGLTVAGLVAVLLIVESGTAHHGNRTTPPPPAVQPTSPANRDGALGTEALDSYFPASGVTYTAGLAFGWTQAKTTAADIRSCLATAGFPQPAFRGSEQLYKLSFPNLSQFPDLTQLAANPGQHYFTSQYLVLHHSTPARQRALDHAQKRCTARYAQPVTRVDNAARSLQITWTSVITSIEHSPTISATQPAFAQCLESHGVPASLATQTNPTSSNPLFAGYFAWADSTNQAAASSSQLASDQRHETRVFIACARPVVTVLERLQVHRRVQFFRAHSAQVARIARLASEMTAPPRH
jgi:hypothetical protein